MGAIWVAIICAMASAIASLGTVGIVKVVKKIRKEKKEEAKRLVLYDPEMCAAHGHNISEIKEDQVFLKQFAKVVLNQQYADMMRRKTGAVNGEQERADEELIAFMKSKSEFKIS